VRNLVSRIKGTKTLSKKCSRKGGLRNIFRLKLEEITGGLQNCKVRNDMILILTRQLQGDNKEKNEMGDTYGTYRGHEKCTRGFDDET
jgi:hypothetical protein